ncbi:maltose O-acetyltransferas-like protein [Wilcoxina mikolae CBS 423.85]|nr:maltose O-acetyltransferas-like protein [Wilcoxina mikolae CBS 423.85]
MDPEKSKMLRGELYHAFTPFLVSERETCSQRCHAFNTASSPSRLDRINLWNPITCTPPLPADTPEDTLSAAAWVEPPFKADYGYNISLGENVYLNWNCTILDTCRVTIGSRTLVGPNVSIFTASHPLDHEVRNGTKGPEMGKEIEIGEDCWIGGGATVLPGVRIGRGSVVGAASVVTKYSVVAGNPARVVRRLRPMEEKVEKQEGEDVKALLKRLEALEKEMNEIKEKLRSV